MALCGSNKSLSDICDSLSFFIILGLAREKQMISRRMLKKLEMES